MPSGIEESFTGIVAEGNSPLAVARTSVVLGEDNRLGNAVERQTLLRLETYFRTRVALS